MTLYPSKRSVILFTGDFSAGALKHMFIIQLYFYSVVQRVNGSGTFVCFVSVFLILVLESFVAQVVNERHNGLLTHGQGGPSAPCHDPIRETTTQLDSFGFSPSQDKIPQASRERCMLP